MAAADRVEGRKGLKRALELRVGAVVLVLLLLTMAVIFLLSNHQDVFSRKVSYQLRFPSIVNLNEQAPVKLGGIEVGRVSSVRFSDNPASRYILVTIRIKREVANRIRTDTVASARSLSLLTGEKYIRLSLGKAEERLKSGSEIIVQESLSFEEIAGAGEQMADTLATILGETSVLLKQINSGEGFLGKMVTDKHFVLETLSRIDQGLAMTTSLLQQMDEGQGLAGRLIGDEEFGRDVTADISLSTKRIERILGRLESEESLAGSLLAENQEGRQIMDDMSRAAGSLRLAAERLEKGEGLLPRLIDDRQYADNVLDDLESIMSSLASIMKKIDNGEGTIGKLIEDPSVYEGLKNVVAGVNESRMLKWYIGRKARKGAKNGKAVQPSTDDSEFGASKKGKETAVFGQMALDQTPDEELIRSEPQ